MSLRFLRLAPLTVTVPLYAAMFRAPLAAALPVDHSIWVEGPTGSMKSTLVALALAHFGPFDRLTLPGAWESTANQLERAAFVLKDLPFVIDDYAPNAETVKEFEAKASRILRGQGNLSGRGRLRSDLTERPSFPPRGLIISTGEQHPSGQSILARTMVVRMAPASVDKDALTRAQGQAARLPHAMAGYISWLAPQMAKLHDALKETFEGTRERAACLGHLRVPEVLAHLWVGLQCALSYAEEIGAVGSVEADDLLGECWGALVALGRDQVRQLEDERRPGASSGSCTPW